VGAGCKRRSSTHRRSGRKLQHRRIFQERQPFLAKQSKFRKTLLGHGIGRRQAQPFEILVLSFLQNAEIEMRPRRKSGASDQADRLADLDVLT
jgi:hypothetical protein